MGKPWWLMAVAVAAVAAGVGCGAASAQATKPRAVVAVVGAATSVPYGWIDFCNRYAPECDVPVLPPRDIDVSAATFKDIERINREVNAAVTPETDMDHWNVVDRWDYPTDGKGDCEDYALAKRKLLMEAGYPRQALLITVVRNAEDEGHAVLTVKTSKGEYVLDNLNDRVKPWLETGYRFVKRQSQEDPNLWRSIGPSGPEPLYTAR